MVDVDVVRLMRSGEEEPGSQKAMKLVDMYDANVIESPIQVDLEFGAPPPQSTLRDGRVDPPREHQLSISPCNHFTRVGDG